MEFNELFELAMKKMEWSQNYISKTFHINRGLLHKYSRGELLMPKTTFLMLLQEMKLNKAERDELCEQYYIEFYGPEKFKRLKYIEYALTGLDSFCLPIDKPEENTSDFDGFQNFITLNSEKDIIRCVHYIFKTAAPGEIFTNYPYSAENFDNAVFRNMVPHSHFSLLHMLTFNRGSDSSGNLNIIFRSIRWLQHQINPFCQYSHTDVMASLPFPYYFAVDSYCLLFAQQQKKGILIKNDAVFQHLKETAAAFISSGFPLAAFPNDMFELKTEVMRAAVNSIDSNWAMYPCLSAIADEGFIRSIIRPEVPGIEALAEMAVQHYTTGLNVDGERYIVSAVGLRRFADTGEIHEIPAALIHEAPPAQRIRFFKKLTLLAEEEKLRILDDSFFSLPESLTIDVFENVVQIAGCFKNIADEMKHRGNYILTIEDKGLKQDFADFNEYMCENKYCYSKHTAKSYLRSLILLCEQMDESQHYKQDCQISVNR